MAVTAVGPALGCGWRPTSSPRRGEEAGKSSEITRMCAGAGARGIYKKKKKAEMKKEICRVFEDGSKMRRKK